jgi:hypothetical protein
VRSDNNTLSVDNRTTRGCHAAGTHVDAWRVTVAVTSQQATFDEYLTGDIPADRILSHLAGEALRLKAYAATGLIDPGESVPGAILNAAHVLQAAGFNSRAV